MGPVKSDTPSTFALCPLGPLPQQRDFYLHEWLPPLDRIEGCLILLAIMNHEDCCSKFQNRDINV